MQGRRLADAPLTKFPIHYDRLKPGDYWLIKTRDGKRLLNVRDHPEDRQYWGKEDDPRYSGNLTGLVLGVIDPHGEYGILSIHTVRLEEDGTVSVRPNDGSTNSILIKHGKKEPWHGYIEHGVWHT